jgi:hypothetical protein
VHALNNNVGARQLRFEQHAAREQCNHLASGNSLELLDDIADGVDYAQVLIGKIFKTVIAVYRSDSDNRSAPLLGLLRIWRIARRSAARIVCEARQHSDIHFVSPMATRSRGPNSLSTNEVSSFLLLQRHGLPPQRSETTAGNAKGAGIAEDKLDAWIIDDEDKRASEFSRRWWLSCGRLFTLTFAVSEWDVNTVIDCMRLAVLND